MKYNIEIIYNNSEIKSMKLNGEQVYSNFNQKKLLKALYDNNIESINQVWKSITEITHNL